MWAQKSTQIPTLKRFYWVRTGSDTQFEMCIAEQELKIQRNAKLPDDDDVHAGDVNGETPPVHKATDIEAAE